MTFLGGGLLQGWHLGFWSMSARFFVAEGLFFGGAFAVGIFLGFMVEC